MDASYNLSKSLVTIRTLRNLSQVEFAREIGVSKSTLQELERGRGSTLGTLDCIAQHLGIPASVLISSTIPPEEMGEMVQLLQQFGWYADWPKQDREQLLTLARQIAQLISKYHP
jgi:transcriptional regulator with XRE-family HTH domain